MRPIFNTENTISRLCQSKRRTRLNKLMCWNPQPQQPTVTSAIRLFFSMSIQTLYFCVAVSPIPRPFSCPQHASPAWPLKSPPVFFLGDPVVHPIHGYLGPHPSPQPKLHLDRFNRFAMHTLETNRHTHTHRPRYVCNDIVHGPMRDLTVPTDW